MSLSPLLLVWPYSSIQPMQRPRRPCYGISKPAVRTTGLKIQVLKASTSQEIHAAFAAMVRERSEALFLGSDPFFTSRRVQLATLAARHAIPLAIPGA